MKRALDGGYELDDGPARVDVDAVHAFLTTSYWAEGRSRQTVEAGPGRRNPADVYVLPECRGQGPGVELVRELVENGPYAARRWLLHAADAHELYCRFGFGPPGERPMERPPAP